MDSSRDLVPSPLPFPDVQLCLDGLIRSLQSGAFSPDMSSHPSGICTTLPHLGHTGFMEDDPLACRHLKPHLFAPMCALCLSKRPFHTQQDNEQQNHQVPSGKPRSRGCNGECACSGVFAELDGVSGSGTSSTMIKAPAVPSADASSTIFENHLLRNGSLRHQISPSTGPKDLDTCMQAPRTRGEQGGMCQNQAMSCSSSQHRGSPKQTLGEDQPNIKIERAAKHLLLRLMREQLQLGSQIEMRGREQLAGFENWQLQEKGKMEQMRCTASLERMSEARGFKSMAMVRNCGCKLQEDIAGQLRAVLEKYERLRKRATSVKRRLQQEIHSKEQLRRRFELTLGDMEERLRAKLRYSQDQKEAVLMDLLHSQEKLKAKEVEGNNLFGQQIALQNEVESLKREVGHVTERLKRGQKEEEKLIEALNARDQERVAGLKTILELQETMKGLYTKLEKCNLEKQAVMEEKDTLRREAEFSHNQLSVELLQLQGEHSKCGKREESLRREAAALGKLVTDLKQDKLQLKKKLEEEQQKCVKKVTSCEEERRRLREAVHILENERQILLAEMKVLRKDYVGLSDRIVQKMEQVEHEGTTDENSRESV